MTRLRAIVVVLAAGILLAACAVMPPAGTTAGAGRPRLVVLVAIDGLPQWQVEAYRDQLAPDGLRRFLERGAWYEQAHYAHAHTVTAAGHAVMLTGAYSDRSGIVGNEWIEPATGQQVYCTEDAAFRYIGEETAPDDGTSPANLRVETLGDVLRRLDPRSKVVAMSGKDRGAILTGGHAGTAYMYMERTGRFASSTYYMPSHPAWVEAFNASKPADAYFHREWRALLGEAAYSRSVPDGAPWFSAGGRLPMSYGEGTAPDKSFYQGLLVGPFIDELTLAFARAAIAGEALGADDAPDILSVSLSGHDYVNHRFGAESRLSHDHVLWLDRMLQDFFRHLDATVGAGRYIVALTADHGFAPVPEYSRTLGHDAGRIDLRASLWRVNAGLSSAFGTGRWIRGTAAMGLVFDRGQAASRGVEVERVAAEAKRLLLAEPGMAAAFTRREVVSGPASGEPYLKSVRRSWDAERSPDVVFVTKPGWIASGYPAGTTHGSPHEYDTHVPILLYGPPWVTSGLVRSPVDVADLAPTLASLLGVPPPSASEGRLLPLPR